MDDGKILKVTLEFQNRTYMAKGKDAESWLRRVNALEMFGFTHASIWMKGFEVKWTEIKGK